MEEEKWQCILIEHRVYLTEKLSPADLWDRMIAKGLVTINQRQRITKTNHADNDQVAAILDHLHRKDEAAFDSFCCIIREIGCGFVLEHILTLASDQGNVNDATQPFQHDRKASLSEEQNSEYVERPTEQTLASDQGNVNDATQPFLHDRKASLSEEQNSEYVGPPTEQMGVMHATQEHRHCFPARMCTRKARRLTFGFTAIGVTVIIVVVSVMTSKSQTRSDSLFYSAAPAISITNACLNAVRNGKQTVSQDDGRCGKKDPGFYPDVGSCASFYLCCAVGKLAGEGSCPGNYSFHPESQLCVDTRDTFYRDPSHCGKYYQCYGTPPIRTEQRSCHKDTYLSFDPPPPTCARKENVKDCHKMPLIPTL